MRVVVIGGGFAGLAAATRLSSEGVHVTLIEARAKLGHDRSADGEATDDPNHRPDHLTLASHRAIEALLARIDARQSLDFIRLGEIVPLAQQTAVGPLLEQFTPRPLAHLAHLARLAHLAQFGRLSVVEQVGVLRVAASEDATPASGETVDAWLSRLSQSAVARDVFWRPLTVALLNDEPAKASAQDLVAALGRELFVDATSPPSAIVSPLGNIPRSGQIFQLFDRLDRLIDLAWFGNLPAVERLGVLRVVAAAVTPDAPATPTPGETVDAWLSRLAQSVGVRDVFWRPLTVALLNDTPARASARDLAAALGRELFVDARNPPLAVALVRKDAPVGAQALRFLEQRGALVRHETVVEELIVGSSGTSAVVQGVVLRGGERIEADVVIAAIAPSAALALIPETHREEPYFRGLASHGPSPVVSFHVWLDRAIASRRFLGFLDAPSGWVLHETRREGGSEKSLFFVQTPADATLADRPSHELHELALTALARVIEGFKEAQIEHVIALVERDDRVGPDNAAPDRPGSSTPIAGLYLAAAALCEGPSVGIEGATRSGEAAAVVALSYQPPPSA